MAWESESASPSVGQAITGGRSTATAGTPTCGLGTTGTIRFTTTHSITTRSISASATGDSTGALITGRATPTGPVTTPATRWCESTTTTRLGTGRSSRRPIATAVRLGPEFRPVSDARRPFPVPSHEERPRRSRAAPQLGLRAALQWGAAAPPVPAWTLADVPPAGQRAGQRRTKGNAVRYRNARLRQAATYGAPRRRDRVQVGPSRRAGIALPRGRPRE